jgi:hypothetical protein
MDQRVDGGRWKTQWRPIAYDDREAPTRNHEPSEDRTIVDDWCCTAFDSGYEVLFIGNNTFENHISSAF